MMRRQIHHPGRGNANLIGITGNNVARTKSHRLRRVGNDKQKAEYQASRAVSFRFIFGLLLALTTEVIWAGDIEAGESKAASCAGCHGSQGVSSIPGFPHLAGQKAGYLVASLKRFKSADTISPVMGPLAKSLSDEDISDLAAFYSSLDRCKLKVVADK